MEKFFANDRRDTERRILRSISANAQSVVVLIEAFIDESGTNVGDRAICVAGYLVLADEADLMAAQWKAVLKDFGLDYFHMTDCAHYKHCEPYKSLGRDACIEVATRFINIIKAHCACGVSVCFNPGEYSIISNYNFRENNYQFAVSTVVSLFQGLLKENKYKGDVAYWLEAGHHHQSYARAALDKMLESAGEHPFSYAFMRKQDSVLLQAADILAWHNQMYIKRIVRGEGIRKDFLSLLEIPHRMMHITNYGKPSEKSTKTKITYQRDPMLLDEDIIQTIIEIYGKP